MANHSDDATQPHRGETFRKRPAQSNSNDTTSVRVPSIEKGAHVRGGK